MIHRFVHIGDAHVTPEGRMGDKEDALWQIRTAGRKFAAQRELAAWLIPGDLLHTKSTIADRNFWRRYLRALLEDAPVVATYGNHDHPGDLDIFTDLKGAHPFYLASEPQIIRFTTATLKNATVACIPYPHKGGLVGAGLAPEAVGPAAQQALDAIFLGLGAELSEERGAICFAIGHLNIGGAVASTGQPQIGREIELTPGLLARLPVGYIGLNHIHKHQVCHGAVYAGSICRMDFGENEPKGFVVASFDDKPSGIPEWPNGTWSWAFHELSVPKQILASVVYERTSPTHDQDFLWAVQNQAGADVRLRYEYDSAYRDQINLDELRKIFSGARSLKLEGVPVNKAEVRAPEIAAAKTLEAKVEAYCARMQIAWSDGLAAKVAALQQQEAM